MPNYNTSAPPTYRVCETGRCYHDLARAALVRDELLDRDGPYPPVYGLDRDLRLDADDETV